MASRRRMKSVEQSIADTDEPSIQLRKDLSWWHLTVFGVSVVIGAGIFTVTASTAGNVTGRRHSVLASREADPDVAADVTSNIAAS